MLQAVLLGAISAVSFVVAMDGMARDGSWVPRYDLSSLLLPAGSDSGNHSDSV